MASPADVEDVFLWKLIGCVSWFALLGSTGLVAASIALQALGIGSPSALSLISTFGASLLVLLTQRLLLSSSIVPPPSARWLASRGWLSNLVARVLLRYRTAASALHAAVFYACCMFSATVSIALLPGAAGASGWSWTLYYGAVLGLHYALSYLLRSAHVLRYPVIQRWRLFRIKQRLAPCVWQALALASAGTLAAVALAFLPSLPSPPPLLVLLRQWIAAALAAWLWCLSCEVLQVVFTEHVQLSAAAEADSLGPLVAGLRCSGNPILQDWALLELTYLAEERSPGGRRRAHVFAPEPGCPGWCELGGFCIGQLADMTLALKQALPAVAGAAKQGAATDGSRAWNVRQVVPGAAQAASERHALVSWHLEAQQQRVAWAVRALAALAAASLREDSLGTLLQEQPGLGDVLLALLDLLLALQQYSKTAAAFRRRQSSVVANVLQRHAPPSLQLQGPRADAAAAALMDNVRVAVYQLVATFDGLQGLLDKVSRPPIYAQLADVKTALATFIVEK